MKAVFDFVQGKLTYDEFETEFLINSEIWDWIQNLVPDDIDDTTCDFRSYYTNMQGFEANNYKVKSTVMSFGYDDIHGHTVAHSLIGALVQYHYPDIICRQPPKESIGDMLEKMKLDYIGGEEVDEIVGNIITSHQDNVKEMKRCLKEKFHVTSRKHPVWVQEPEWPLYNGNPMKFDSQKSEGEKHTYTFSDVHTGAVKIVIQYT